jgi:Tfp pilus assembly protein PilF
MFTSMIELCEKLGYNYDEKEQYLEEEVLNLFNNDEIKDTEDALMLGWLSIYYKTKGDIEKMKEYSRKSIDKGNVNELVNLATYLMLTENKDEEALLMFEEAITHGGQTEFFAKVNMVQYYSRKGDEKKASEILETALELEAALKYKKENLIVNIIN